MSNFSQQPPPFGLLSFPNSQPNAGYPPPQGPWNPSESLQQQQPPYGYPPSQLGGFPINYNPGQKNEVPINDMNLRDQSLYNRYYQNMPVNHFQKPQNNCLQNVSSASPGIFQRQDRPQPSPGPSPYYQYGMPTDNNKYLNWNSRQPFNPPPPPPQFNPGMQHMQYDNQNQQFMSYMDPSNSNCNVYVRGLPPDMTDKRFLELCSSYGNVLSSKCIINNSTNTCKGFGFALYTDVSQALAAIEGLNKLPYQASLAKSTRPFCYNKPLNEIPDQMNYHSHVQPMFETLHNENQYSEPSANVYLCNLPLNMNEAVSPLYFYSLN